MFITNVKKIIKEYWYIVLGALVAFFYLVFPRSSKVSISKTKHDEYTRGIEDATALENLKQERIENAVSESIKNMIHIEDEKRERIAALAEKTQEELTSELSKKFKIKETDS